MNTPNNSPETFWDDQPTNPYEYATHQLRKRAQQYLDHATTYDTLGFHKKADTAREIAHQHRTVADHIEKLGTHPESDPTS